MTRTYSDTCPTTVLIGTGGGVASGLTNANTTMELGSSLSGFLTPPFVLGIEPGTPNEELVLVTAGSGTSGSPYTITRAQGTTTAKAHATGSAVAHRVYSQDFADVATHLNNTTIHCVPGEWRPTDVGFSAWTYDISMAIGTPLLVTGGTLYMTRCILPEEKTYSFTNAHAYVTTAGATLTSGQNFFAVYNSAGSSLLKQSVTAHTSWQSAGLSTVGLASTLTVTGGAGVYVWLTLYSVGTTKPTFARFGSTAVTGITNGQNALYNALGPLGGGVARAATCANGTALTTAPPATTGAITADPAGQLWMALS